MKKLFSAFLAIAMSMALAVPVFADGEPNRETKYTIDTQTPTVDVTVPTAGAVKLNPYQIKVKNVAALGIGNEENDGETGSVLAAKTFIVNKSNVPVKMSLTVSGKIPDGSNAKFLTAAPAPTEKNRAVFMFVDVGAVAEAADADALATATATALCAATYDATKLYDATAKTGSQGLVKAGDLKMVDVLTIPVPSGTDATAANYVPIQIGGECATTPTDAWTAADTVDVTMTFSFQPTVTAAAATPAAGV